MTEEIHATMYFSFLSFSFSLSVFFLFSIVAQAIVPAANTFTIINEGSFGDDGTENGATYRGLPDLQSNIFGLCFYNTTPNAYTFAIRMGLRPEESGNNILRWVWGANRENPVKDNARLTFGTDGNLALADADGRVVWQTGTSNKGVVGINMLRNGNLVLVDSRGQFVWQSFDSPTDTLLVGQGLRQGGIDRLVSKVSQADGSKGPYSFVLEKKKLALYLTSKNSQKPLLYYTTGDEFENQNDINRMNFNSEAETEAAVAYGLSYNYYINGFFYNNDTVPVVRRIARVKYDSTLSFLRLEPDGNLRTYTYYDKVRTGSWDITNTLFNREGTRSVSECRLPERCGSLGVCNNNQCVGCPIPQGWLPWSQSCATPKLASCTKGKLQKVSYYKVVGVEHFTNEYTDGEGPLKVSECRRKCDMDCGCLGFFYKEESSRCLLAPELRTLSQVSSQTHMAYIKMAT